MGRDRSRVMAALVVVLVCCACGTSPTQRHTTGDPASTKAAKAAFVTGVDDFCRAYYEGQRASDEHYPTTAVRHRYDEALETKTRQADAMLSGLHPPPALAKTFARFVKNERALYRSLVAATANDVNSANAGENPALADTLTRRHELAVPLGAHECDGLLPKSQRRAAVAALTRWDLTPDWHQACVELATNQYARTMWAGTADPLSACRQAFEGRHSGAYPLPQGIRVSSITGVESLSATVHFTEVPDCGCGNIVARLYFDHHRWLVRETYQE